MGCMVLGSHLDSEVFWDLHLKNNAMQKHEIQVHKNLVALLPGSGTRTTVEPLYNGHLRGPTFCPF